MNQNTDRTATVWKNTFKKNIRLFAMILLTEFLSLAVFILYKLPIEPFLYGATLVVVITLVLIFLEGLRDQKRARERAVILSSVDTYWNSLPDAESFEEEDYQEMIQALGRRAESLFTEFSNEQQDTLDYFTAWVHQIKTPIAVMRLRLSSEDSDENRALLSELFRIEQYVDMVLQYIRLGSKSNDLVIAEYPLDDMVRESIRKYASSFIQRRLKMDFQPTNLSVVTDRKWFGVVLDQFFSNAIKYTAAGGITIRVDGQQRLCITDTGIGIAEEDLPRIFEKGFTGKNGRIGQKSSGLGLYLAKRAAILLRHKVGAESVLGEGSTFYIDLNGSTNK